MYSEIIVLLLDVREYKERIRSRKRAEAALSRYGQSVLAVDTERGEATRRGSPAASALFLRKYQFLIILYISDIQFVNNFKITFPLRSPPGIWARLSVTELHEKEIKKKWKKIKKTQKKWVELLTLFRQRYIFSITVATLSCDSRTKQKVLWQIREGNNWLNNFYMFLYNQRTKTYPRISVLEVRL